MKSTFAKSFVRDLKKIKNKQALDAIAKTIQQVETAAGPAEIADLKKLKGFEHFFRIRVGNLRLGVSIAEGVVDFVRCLDRKEIYRHFPK